VIPKSVKEELQVDDNMGTDLWQKYIQKETKMACQYSSSWKMTTRHPLDINVLIVM
jgi:hypothetical protein